MESAYYIPELSDLFIGYECELKGDSGDWVHSCIPSIFMPKMKKWLEKDKVRTPYLTKEQIEAEGWVRTQNYHMEHDITLNRGNYSCAFMGNLIEIYGSDPYDEILFSGKCPSINEFRKIIKYLEI